MDVNWTSGHVEPSTLKAGSSYLNTQTNETFRLVQRLPVLDPNGAGGIAAEGWLVETTGRAASAGGTGNGYLPDGTLRAMAAGGAIIPV